MPKFKVYAERTETLCAIIKADSAEEAVDQNDIALNTHIDSSKVDYIRIYKDEVDYNTFLDYCSMPHAVLSKEDDGNSVYFYTVSQQNINPDKHLE